MNNISSNTLFHFSNWENLLSILENGFYPRFRTEKITFLKNIPFDVAIPMVSFCDIPLSQIKNHVRRYGSYGIGLTKSWGIYNGMNPVLYLKHDSVLAKNLDNSLKSLGIFIALQEKRSEELKERHEKELKNIEKLFSTRTETLEDSKKRFEYSKKLFNEHFKYTEMVRKEINNIKSSTDALFMILKYLKQYEGYSLRRGDEKGKIRFYDEREWRYVPELDKYKEQLEKDGVKAGLVLNINLFNHDSRNSANDFLKTLRLRFKPKNIKYIIVKKEGEILSMIKALEDIKGNLYPSDIIKKLTSRILTYEQIKSDF